MLSDTTKSLKISEPILSVSKYIQNVNKTCAITFGILSKKKLQFINFKTALLCKASSVKSENIILESRRSPINHVIVQKMTRILWISSHISSSAARFEFALFCLISAGSGPVDETGDISSAGNEMLSFSRRLLPNESSNQLTQALKLIPVQ
jgi:hypothetical protein